MLTAVPPDPVLAVPALAHTGRPLAPHDLWGAWNFDPLLIAGVAATAWAYRRGRPPGAPAWRQACFAGGLAAVAGAVVSPLDALSGALASAHMVQHLLLVLVAAPLLALSAPGAALQGAVPASLRRGAVRARRWGAVRAVRRGMRHPATVWLLHVGTLWFWHAAVPYDAALATRPVHVVEHATFLVTALLFWRVVLGARAAGRVSNGFGVLLVFAAALQSVFLAVLLTFAGSPWYRAYAATTSAWGLTPLADQQLAGVLMWVPAGLVYLAAGLALAVTWVHATERVAWERTGSGG